MFVIRCLNSGLMVAVIEPPIVVYLLGEYL